MPDPGDCGGSFLCMPHKCSQVSCKQHRDKSAQNLCSPAKKGCSQYASQSNEDFLLQKSKELAAGVRQSWADFHAAYAPLHAEKLEAKQRKQAATKHITEICRQQKQAAEDEYKAATEKHKATLAEADSKQADELIQIQQVYKNTVLPLKTKIVELVEASDAQQLKIVEQMRALDKPEKEVCKVPTSFAPTAFHACSPACVS